MLAKGAGPSLFGVLLGSDIASTIAVGASAIATFILALFTWRLAKKTTAMAESADAEAKAVVEQGKSIKDQADAVALQAQAATEQAALTRESLQTSVRPWLTLGQGKPAGVAPYQANQRIGIFTTESLISVGLSLTNVGNGVGQVPLLRFALHETESGSHVHIWSSRPCDHRPTSQSSLGLAYRFARSP